MKILRSFTLIGFLVCGQSACLTGSQAQNSLEARLKTDSEESVPVVCLETVSESVPVVCLESMPKSTYTKPLNSVTQKEAQVKLLSLAEQKKRESRTQKLQKQIIPQIILGQHPNTQKIVTQQAHPSQLTASEMTSIFGKEEARTKRDCAVAQMLGLYSVLPVELIKMIIDYTQFAGNCQHTFKSTSNDGLSALALTSDGILVCGSSTNNMIELWDLGIGKKLGSFNSNAKGINTLIANGRRGLVSGDNGGKIKVWQLIPRVIQTSEISAHSNEISALALLPIQKNQPLKRIASGSWDCLVKVWNLQNGKCLRILKGHKSPINAITAQDNHNCDSCVISGSDDGIIKLWNPITGQCLKTLAKNSNEISVLAALPNGNFVSALGSASTSHDNCIKVWDCAAQQYSQILPEHPFIIFTLTALPNGNIVFGSDDFSVKIWNPSKNRYEHQLKGHTGTIENIVVSTDNILASIDSNKNIKIWY